MKSEWQKKKNHKKRSGGRNKKFQEFYCVREAKIPAKRIKIFVFN